jgi:hypothetical protein
MKPGATQFTVAPRTRDVDGEGPGEGLDAGLGRSRGRKGHEAAREGVGHEGRDADQAARRPGLDQPGLDRRRQFEEGRGHGVLAGIPGRAIELADLRAVGEARVAHDHVEMTERLDRFIDEARRRAGLGEIAFEDQGLRAGTGGECCYPLEPGTVAAGMQGQSRVRRGQRAGGCGADARGGTGDEDHAGRCSHADRSRIPHA